MQNTITIVSFTDEKMQSLIPQIAELRIEVFKEYPFLYIGDYEYEKKYLQKFTSMNDAIVVAAFDNSTPIGMSTGYPFTYEADGLKQVFLSAGRNPADYFCFGESVLRKTYRGQGIGKKFCDEREAHVRKLGKYRYICFYTSMRPLDDPRRPADYRPLALFWQSRGFKEHPELIGTVSYQEIGEDKESSKKMIFWTKEL